MTSPRNLLVRLAGALNVSGMPWMITGSTASAFYGEPRATQDIDFLVDPTPEQLRILLEQRNLVRLELDLTERLRAQIDAYIKYQVCRRRRDMGR